ncbi:ubiquitin carboxyl-terminal hydrolase 1 [Echria macrotheca]|uniref:ubiquitinyl hydrolase 1 n=1 Tax=Echria macrotheca TaxID=438768 RepID=A0AAJ0FH53_9PEZI|nr:ubiquitin carboxyl-terminal hydrolase 1 [Echria macrotheca]
MNSDSRRIVSHFDIYNQPGVYTSHSLSATLWDRITSPTTVISILLLVLTYLYRILFQQGRISHLSPVLWDCFVSVVPATALVKLDNWLNPPLFPTPMLTQPRSLNHAAKSEVLRRTLGIDKPGGLIQTVSQAGRRGLTGLSSAARGLKSTTDRPPGLGNYDNSCYQNSILQGLASLKPLPDYLSALPTPDDGRPVVRTTDALRTLIADLNTSSNNGKTLWTPGVLKNMSTWQQQDAQEYYSKLLDEIDKEIAKATKRRPRPLSIETESSSDDASESQHSDDSGYHSLSAPSKPQDFRLNRNPLEGLVAQRVACVACGYCEGLTMIPFNCLTLNLGVGHEEHDLYERLDNFAKVEPINGVHCAKCSLLKVQAVIESLLEKRPDDPQLRSRLSAIQEALDEDAFDDKTLEKCRVAPQKMVTSTKTKQTVVARPPQCLAIHMNRSVFDENTGRLFKNLAAVRFPKLLDLGPWCLGSADRFSGKKRDAAAVFKGGIDETHVRPEEEEWLLDPLSSMVAGDLRPSKITGPIYELRAVVTHYGQHDNGHYVCYRRVTAPSSSPTQETTKPAKLASEGVDLGGLDEDAPPQTEGATPDPECENGQESVEEPAEVDQTGLAEEESELVTQWWRLSDESVYKVDEEDVLAQSGVFMLFYDCVDQNSVLVSDLDSPADSRSGSEDEGDRLSWKRSCVTGWSNRKAGEVESQDDVLSRAIAIPLPE